jgi:hypothetical protein
MQPVQLIFSFLPDSLWVSNTYSIRAVTLPKSNAMFPMRSQYNELFYDEKIN